MTRTHGVLASIAIVATVLSATSSWAQQGSSIAGIIRDTSGAVLPGVTVEAASPTLIEKVRTGITDDQGQYRIVDLGPGTYSVTFTLTGFNTLRREGVVLTAGFTASVNAEMSVGSLQETVVVSGASPLVDIQNVRQQSIISRQQLDDIPVSKGAVTVFTGLIPGLTGQVDVGGSAGVHMGQTASNVTFHGKGALKRQFDGMKINGNNGNGAASGIIVHTAFAEEVVVETGGVSAESAASGILMNMIPKEGGNSFRFVASGLFTNESLQSDNLSDEVLARGLTTVNKVFTIWDTDVSLGGPIKKDRLWFLAGQRSAYSTQQVPGVFFNKTQGTPFYTPDLNRPAYRQQDLESGVLRLTWQASSKDKIGMFVDVQRMCICRHTVGTGFVAPEAVPRFNFWPNLLVQGTWSSPRTNKLLFEAGAAAVISRWPNTRQPETGPDDISIVEQSTGFRYNSGQFQIVSYGDPKVADRYDQRFSVSYVSGSHAYKFGVQAEEGPYAAAFEANGAREYFFLNGRPVALSQFAMPYLEKATLRADIGLYAQDTWTVRRVTLSYGLRFDYINASVPEQHVPAGPWVPARDFAPVKNVPNWSDLNPRVGVSYDLFGTGKTALKASLGRYVGLAGVDIATANNPMVTSVNSAQRTWSDTNGNYIPDCDLTNFSTNGECGPIGNQNFGKNNPNATRYDPRLIDGFGQRDYNWDFAAEVHQEVRLGMSISAGYYRNWYGNFRATDNLAVQQADYSPFCITAPTTSANGFSLPGGGGYPVCGLYDVVPGKFGQVTNLVTQASDFGKQTQVNNFFNVSTNIRLASGLQFGGGVDTGRTVNDSCFVIDSPQQLLYCHVVTPFKAQTDVKFHGTYPLGRGVFLSGKLQNISGPNVTANYTATNAQIAPSLGRNLAACGSRTIETCTATATVPLIAPQTLFEDRRTQLDLRVTKTFGLGPAKRLDMNFDVYNVLNSSAILVVNNTFGPQWRRPTSTSSTGAGVLDGRLFEFSGRVAF